MRETWYVLEDGRAADPLEVDMIDGVLTHSSGVAVAIGPHGPKSKGVDVEAGKPKAKEVTAKPSKKRGYKTRDVKAD